MKKMITALLWVVLILLCFAACGSSQIPGRYDLTAIESEGVTISVSDIKDADTQMYLQLNADGTGVMQIGAEAAQMQWKDGMLWPVGQEDDKVPFTVENGVLTMHQDGQTMTFTKAK
ncbi:MAG: hypothetical protein J6Q53_07335 [Oscillospiraceae bacterium]|nr:hypothetical protein [Oscillospiraceae bacterium]